jgi:hypothetical protein
VGRAGAALAVLSAALHAASLGHMTHQGPFVTVSMVLMVGGCLWCARHLWCRAAPQDWATVAVMNLVMIALHTPPGGGHHVHSPSPVPLANLPAGQAMPLMTWAVGVAAAEAAIATIVLVVGTNLRNRCLFQGSVTVGPQKGESRHDRRCASRLS